MTTNETVYAIYREDDLYEVQTDLSYAKERRQYLDESFFGLFTVKEMKLQEIEQ